MPTLPLSSVSVILLAGGKGERMGTSLPKQYLSLKHKPLVTYSLDVFFAIPAIYEVIVVCDPQFHSYFDAYPVTFAPPGPRRQDSMISGLQATSPSTPWVCIHDAARPFITPALVEKLLEEGMTEGAATLATPATSTIKEAHNKNYVLKTLKRENLWEIQTPQFLSRSLLIEGIQKANKENLTVTDDVSFAELLGHPVKLVQGTPKNLKITNPIDLLIAERVIEMNYSEVVS